MSSAITIFLKSAVKHEGIPFEIRRYAPNAETGVTFQKYVMSVYYALNL
jgi:DNA-damage-inducible protein J